MSPSPTINDKIKILIDHLSASQALINHLFRDESDSSLLLGKAITEVIENSAHLSVTEQLEKRNK